MTNATVPDYEVVREFNRQRRCAPIRGSATAALDNDLVRQTLEFAVRAQRKGKPPLPLVITEPSPQQRAANDLD